MDTITKAEFNAILIRMILGSYLPENSTVRYGEYNKVAAHLNIIKKWAGTTPISRKDASLMLFRAYKNQLFSLKDIGGYESFVLKNHEQFLNKI